MKRILSMALIAFAALAPAGYAATIDPIPSSLTYPTPPRQKLQRAPIGSLVRHEVHRNGSDYRETYLIQPDRSLKLVNRIKARRK